MEFDVVVVGSGPGGYNAAFRAADLQLNVALVERFDVLGGVCLNVGCIPSKALLHIAEGLNTVKELQEIGLSGDVPNPDKSLDKIHAYRDKAIKRLGGGLMSLAKQRRVTVVHGFAKFKDPHTFTIHDPVTGGATKEELRFRNTILATGSRVIQIPGFPNDDPRLIDSTGALALEDVPEKFLIIGGGIIGVEMAEVYATMGSQVTIVEMSDQLIPSADKDLVAPLTAHFNKVAKVHLKTKVTAIKAEKKGLKATLEFANGEKQTDLYDKVLVAVGRRPNGDQINAAAADVTVDEYGFVPVDAQQRTNIPHIFAIGDLVGQPMLAHKASHEGHVAAEVIAGKKTAFSPMGIPSVAYTAPEIAWAGLTEAEAKEKGIQYTKGIFPWAASGRAVSMQASEGKTKLLFEAETHRIIGGGIVGKNAGELISEVMLAIEMGCDMVDIGKTIHPHPTLGETIAFASEVAHGSITEIYIPQK